MGHRGIAGNNQLLLGTAALRWAADVRHNDTVCLFVLRGLAAGGFGRYLAVGGTRDLLLAVDCAGVFVGELCLARPPDFRLCAHIGAGGGLTHFALLPALLLRAAFGGGVRLLALRHGGYLFDGELEAEVAPALAAEPARVRRIRVQKTLSGAKLAQIEGFQHGGFEEVALRLAEFGLPGPPPYLAVLEAPPVLTLDEHRLPPQLREGYVVPVQDLFHVLLPAEQTRARLLLLGARDVQDPLVFDYVLILSSVFVRRSVLFQGAELVGRNLVSGLFGSDAGLADLGVVTLNDPGRGGVRAAAVLVVLFALNARGADVLVLLQLLGGRVFLLLRLLLRKLRKLVVGLQGFLVRRGLEVLQRLLKFEPLAPVRVKGCRCDPRLVVSVVALVFHLI